MGEGAWQIGGRHRFPDGLEQPKRQRRHRARRFGRRFVLEQIGVEETGEKQVFVLGDFAQRAGVAHDQNGTVPVPGTRQAKDTGRIGGRQVRRGFHRAADLVFLTDQKGRVEPAAHDIGCRGPGLREERVGFLHRAHVQKLVDPGEEHGLPVTAARLRRIEFGQQNLGQKRLQGRKHIGPLVGNAAHDVLGL